MAETKPALLEQTQPVIENCNAFVIQLQLLIYKSSCNSLTHPLLSKTQSSTHVANIDHKYLQCSKNNILQISFHQLALITTGYQLTNNGQVSIHNVHNISCVSNKSPVYVCALDAEAAFDGIPHAIMFAKAMEVVPVLYWRILVFWYRRLVVYIKWDEQISDAIHIPREPDKVVYPHHLYSTSYIRILSNCYQEKTVE